MSKTNNDKGLFPGLFPDLPIDHSLEAIIDEADRRFDAELSAVCQAIRNKRPDQKAYAASNTGRQSTFIVFGKGCRPIYVACRLGDHLWRAQRYAADFNRAECR